MLIWKHKFTEIDLFIYYFHRLKWNYVWVLISKRIMKTIRISNIFLPYWLIVISFLFISFVIDVSGNLLNILVHFYHSFQLHTFLNTQVKLLIFYLRLRRHCSLTVNKFKVVLLMDFIHFEIIFALLYCFLDHAWYFYLLAFIHPYKR